MWGIGHTVEEIALISEEALRSTTGKHCHSQTGGGIGEGDVQTPEARSVLQRLELISRVPVRTWSNRADVKTSKRGRGNLTSLLSSPSVFYQVFYWPNLPAQKLVQGSLSIAVPWEMEKSSSG